VDEKAIIASIEQMVCEVQRYVPGYRLKSAPVTDRRQTPWGAKAVIVLLLEVEGAGDFLPSYAGNLDIMTSAAYRIGDLFAQNLQNKAEVSA
jgi:acetaldehyde dehydrogenase